MKRGFLYGSIFVACFSVSLILHLPASFAIKQAPTVRGLTIEGVEGSLWQGSANSVSWQNVSYGAVQWDLQFSQLFQAKAEVAVRFGRQSDMGLRGKGTVGYGLDGAYVDNLVVALPAERVLDYAPAIPVPISVNGQLEVAIKHAVYAQPWCLSGDGTLVWSEGGIESPIGALKVGTVITEFTCQDSMIVAKGDQNNAEVSSEFSAQLSPDQSYSTSAWFKPGAEFPSSMAEQLSWLGNPNDKGQYQFSYQGRL